MTSDLGSVPTEDGRQVSVGIDGHHIIIAVRHGTESVSLHDARILAVLITKAADYAERD